MEVNDNERVIVISSGAPQTCMQRGIGDVTTITDEWYKNGVPVIYIGIGDMANKTAIDKLTNDPKNTIMVPDIKDKTPDELGKVADEAGKQVTAAPPKQPTTSVTTQQH
ncbi:hypothetical protein COOONC_16988, partial [Cooperia oncophora]